MKKNLDYLLLVCSAPILVLGIFVNMASAQSWQDKLRDWGRSTTQSIQQTTENARRNVENWERKNRISEKMNENLNNYKRETDKIIKEKSERAKEYWNTEGRTRVSDSYQNVRYTLDKAYTTYSPRAASELERTYNHFKDTGPAVVNNCSRAMGEWGETAGIKLNEFYRNYGKPAGDKLYNDLQHFSGEARVKIVESYAKWGPEVGNSIKDAYSRYSPEAATALQRAYTDFGPIVGTAIKAAYEKYKPQVAQGIHSTYTQYGTAIGEMIFDTYLQYNATIGEEIRNVYLPKIMKTISDERNQRMAIYTVGKVIDIYQNKSAYAHKGLKTLADTRIKTRYGTTSLSEESRKWIRSNCPALIGTDIEQDPAKVVTYVLLFPDKRVIFQDIKLIPGQNGQAVSCSQKLSEVSGIDVDQTIEVLDLMANIEACSRGDVDPDFLIENAEAIQKIINENNQRSS